jgi:hypothetical protein
MSEIKVEVLKHPTEEDWQWVKLLALNTVGQKYLMDKEMSLALKKKYLKSEHSPIRYLHFVIRMEIPYYISVHFRTHKFGVEHFVQSQRNDRQDNYDRRKAPQDSPVSHIMYIDAPELMYIARKRLCGKADVDTQKVMRAIVREVLKTNPEFADVLVPNCQYLHECPEFQSCGRWPVKEKEELGVEHQTPKKPAEPYSPKCIGRLESFDLDTIRPAVDRVTNTAGMTSFAFTGRDVLRCEAMREIFVSIAHWVTGDDSDLAIRDEDVMLQGQYGAELYITATCLNNGRSYRDKVTSLCILNDMKLGGVNWAFTGGPTGADPVTPELCVEMMRKFLQSLPWNEGMLPDCLRRLNRA